MSFTDGLHNRVDIIPKIENVSNRTVKNQMMNDTSQMVEDVPCRIIRDEKAMFLPEVHIQIGDVIKDRQLHVKYEIEKIKLQYARRKLHHITCMIRKAPEKKV